jgi:PPOX class probable F420-dependent enzyme
MLTAGDLAFLDAQRVARLATTTPGGAPHVVPVCFARMGERLYVPIDAKPKRGDPRRLARLRNLHARPEAVLLVDHYADDWTQLRWLMIRATATILEADEEIGRTGRAAGRERDQALAALEARYPQYAAMGLASLGLPTIALTPVGVTRWSARGADGA